MLSNKNDVTDTNVVNILADSLNFTKSINK